MNELPPIVAYRVVDRSEKRIYQGPDLDAAWHAAMMHDKPATVYTRREKSRYWAVYTYARPDPNYRR
mgnify:CR=1 FL=1